MSRDTSLTFRQAISARETGEVPLLLVEVSHDTDLPEPIRVSSDAVNTTSNGNLYVSYPFDVWLPDDEYDHAPTCRIRIDNVDRSLTVGIRSLTSPPTVRVMVVLASSPNTIEVDFPDFKLVKISYDAFVIEGNVTVENYLNEPYPGDSFMPSGFPGMY